MSCSSERAWRWTGSDRSPPCPRPWSTMPCAAIRRACRTWSGPNSAPTRTSPTVPSSWSPLASARASEPKALEPISAGVLGLARDAAGGVGASLEAAFRYLVTAVDAPAVAALLDAVECGHDAVPLPSRGTQDRLGPVVLRQAGARVGGISVETADRLDALQDRDRPV